MAVVTNQKNLQISFALDDGNGNVSFMTLPIKPEELTRTEPNRVTTQQTLDGVFIDEFGRGLTTISISGNTGWGQGTRPAGDLMFLKLRDEFIHEWGNQRRKRIDAGQDPNFVRLIFIDALNGPYVADVVPTQFVLRRSKSQPLLYLYNISLTVIAENAVNPYPELQETIEDEAKVSASVDSMTESTEALTGTTPPAAGEAPGGLIGKLDGLADRIGTLGQSALATTKQTFAPAMALANQIIATAAAANRVLTAAEQATVNVAKELSATATKMWDAVASVAGLPAAAKAAIMQIKGAFSNVSCVLSNGFIDALGKATTAGYPYGSSNCSSTSYGGSAPSTTSTFVSPSDALGITTTPSAAEAITSILHIDYTMPIDTDLLQAQIDLLNDGTIVDPDDPDGPDDPDDPDYPDDPIVPTYDLRIYNSALPQIIIDQIDELHRNIFVDRVQTTISFQMPLGDGNTTQIGPYFAIQTNFLDFTSSATLAASTTINNTYREYTGFAGGTGYIGIIFGYSTKVASTEVVYQFSGPTFETEQVGFGSGSPSFTNVINIKYELDHDNLGINTELNKQLVQNFGNITKHVAMVKLAYESGLITRSDIKKYSPYLDGLYTAQEIGIDDPSYPF